VNMKLPDFKRFHPFEKLKKEMGVDADMPGNFYLVLNWDRVSIRELTTLEGQGIEVSSDKFWFLADGSIAYKDIRVLLYKRDQKPDQEIETSLQYHISRCRTLVEMEKLGRSSKYIISTRTDGIFNYNLFDRFGEKINKTGKLDVCKNCLSQFNYNDYGYHSSSRKRRRSAFDNFSLSEFFARFSCSPVGHTPLQNYAENSPIIFSSKWNNKNLEYKERSKWKCQSCGKIFKEEIHQKYLHTHHKDGSLLNNRASNIEVLCIMCHSRQPQHSQLERLPDYRDYGSSKLKTKKGD
jgi:hypothetical protein